MLYEQNFLPSGARDGSRREAATGSARTDAFLAAPHDVLPVPSRARRRLALEIYLVAVALACCFTALLRRHGRLFEQRLLLESHIAALSNFLARCSGEWHNFPVTGAEYLKDELPQAQDLSLFGADSIYQYLCAARTKAGRDSLADALSPFPADLALARKRQKAVAELITRPRLVLDLTAAAALLPALPVF